MVYNNVHIISCKYRPVYYIVRSSIKILIDIFKIVMMSFKSLLFEKLINLSVSQEENKS